MIHWRGCMLVLVLSEIFSAGPSLAADATNGEAIAKRQCVACHFVRRDQSSASADVPPFDEIAMRHTDLKNLEAILAGPHPRMPELRLSPSEIDDIAAYIHSLDPTTLWRPNP